jgi:hypothetical protein
MENKPHQYYPKLLITNNARKHIRVKSFFDPKCGLWKVVINLRKNELKE